MKSSASEEIRDAYFNLGRLSRYSSLAKLGISALERLWSGFDSDSELINYSNIFSSKEG